MTRVAAIDLGRVRVGIAVSDELGKMAHTRPALDGRNRPALIAALARLAKDEGVTRFLVGLPLDMSGRAGIAANRAARFCQQLANAAGVDVEMVDERLSSVQAERELSALGARREAISAKVDGVAAAIILQQWLDGQAGSASSGSDAGSDR
jgi:putative Holliday junction resolvase